LIVLAMDAAASSMVQRVVSLVRAAPRSRVAAHHASSSMAPVAPAAAPLVEVRRRRDGRVAALECSGFETPELRRRRELSQAVKEPSPLAAPVLPTITTTTAAAAAAAAVTTPAVATTTDTTTTTTTVAVARVGLHMDWSCFSGSLQRLDLSGNGLEGSLPEGFASLQSLRSLILRDNALSGHLPAYLAALPALQEVTTLSCFLAFVVITF